MNIRTLIYSALISLIPFTAAFAQSANYVPVASLSVLGSTTGPYYLYPNLKPLVMVQNVGPYYYAPTCPGTADAYWYVAAITGCYVHEPIPSTSFFYAVATQTTNYTVTAGVNLVPVNTSSGNVTITVPESLGNATNPYIVRVLKVSSDTNQVIISANGTTPYAYIISQNDAGGAGYLDVEVNGSSIRVFGNP